jgi:hypothetical protein
MRSTRRQRRPLWRLDLIGRRGCHEHYVGGGKVSARYDDHYETIWEYKGPGGREEAGDVFLVPRSCLG